MSSKYWDPLSNSSPWSPFNWESKNEFPFVNVSLSSDVSVILEVLIGLKLYALSVTIVYPKSFSPLLSLKSHSLNNETKGLFDITDPWLFSKVREGHWDHCFCLYFYTKNFITYGIK